MTRRWLPVVVILLVVGAAGWTIHAGRIGGTLSAFLPQGASPEQRLVADELRHGTAGRLLFVTLRGPDPEAAQEAAPRLRERLAGADDLHFVATRPDPALLAARGRIFEYRYLLSDRVEAGLFEAPRLHARLSNLVTRLRGSGPPVDERVASADPTGEYRYVIARAFGGRGDATSGAWRTPGGWPVLVALPRAPPFELDAQARAIERIEQAAAELGPGLTAELSGAPAIAVATRARIRSEVIRITSIAALAVATIIALALRSVRALLVCVLPVGAGLVVGTAAVIAVFGQVHGITLAFAATLLGVTVDYPLHLLWHVRHAGGWTPPPGVRQPLALGAVSTAITFAAFGIGGFPGLQQLAVLSVCGILTAAAVTLWVLPRLPLRPRWQPVPGAGRPGRATLRPRAALPALALVAAGAAIATTTLRLDTDLSALSPIPETLRERDRAARAATGIAAPGHLVRVTAGEREAVLQRTERVAARLAGLRDDGLLGRASPVTTIMPSAATQARRRDRLPTPAALRRALRDAVEPLPLRPQAFAPFVADVAASRGLEPLVPEALPAGFLRRWVGDRLFRYEGEWTSIVGLGQIGAAAAVADAVRPVNGASLLDVTAITGRLVSHYQQAALVRFAAGCGVIVLLLAAVLRDTRRTAAVVLTVAGAVAGTAGLLGLTAGTINVFEVISLLLVAGLGLDYGLFATGAARGRGSVGVCALSTATAFGLLASAGIPVLRDVGATVAVGTVLAWLLAVGLARPETGETAA